MSKVTKFIPGALATIAVLALINNVEMARPLKELIQGDGRSWF